MNLNNDLPWVPRQREKSGNSLIRNEGIVGTGYPEKYEVTESSGV